MHSARASIPTAAPTAGKGGSKQQTKLEPLRIGKGVKGLTRFPSKGRFSCRHVGLLACGVTLFSAPSQGQAPQWLLQISFRSQLRGSAGFAPASLATAADCDTP